MYLEGSGRRFLLSAKSFDVGKYYISAYEGFPNIDTKPKCGYVARVERQRDSSFSVSLDYCHLCDQKLGQFCCGRSNTEREVIARISHTVKRYRKVNMEFRCISVTIPTISKSGTRKVWCPRSFRKVNPNLPNSADVNEALSCTPKMGMRLVSKLPEWNEDAKNLVVRFQGSGRILVASAKNFLLYEEKKSGPDLAELSMSHIEESPTVSSNVNGNDSGQRDRARTSSMEPIERSNSGPMSDGTADVDIEGGASSPSKSPQVASLTNQNIRKLSSRSKSSTHSEAVEIDPTGDEASRSSKNSKNSSRRDRSSLKTDKTTKETKEMREQRRRDRDSDAGSTHSGTLKPRQSSSSRSGSPRAAAAAPSPKKSPRDSEESSVLQFGKSTATRFVLDFKYPLSPLQAFGIAISTFASDEITDTNHEVNHMNSPVVVSRKQMEYSRARSASMGSFKAPFVFSPLKSPFPEK